MFGLAAVSAQAAPLPETMARLIRRAEEELNSSQLQLFTLENRNLSNVNVAVAHAAWHAANDLRPTAILCCTRTGSTARHMASFRPLTTLYGLTADPRALRQLSLCWGVQPLLQPQPAASTEEVMSQAIAVARARGAVQSGDIVIVLGGSPAAGPGHTDTIRVMTVASG